MFNINNMIYSFISILLVLTPIFNIEESLALIFGGIINNSTALTPIYIKAIKDLGFILIVLIGFIGMLKLRKISKVSFLILLYMILIILTEFFYKDNLLIFLAGIRWLMPIILIIFLIPYVKRNLLTKIAKILGYLFILNFIFQVLQLFFAGGWFGLNVFGLSARNPGMFFIPSTSAFFIILVLFFTMFYLNNNVYKKLIFVLSPLSLFLTASGSGLAVYIVIVFIYLLKKKYFKLTPIFVIISFFILIYSIDDITGRTNLIEESFGTRMTIFINLLENSNFVSLNFGNATNTGILLANEYSNNSFITDSTYGAVLVNIGLISLIFILVVLFINIFLSFLNNNKEIMIFTMMFGLFSATTSILEAYPMNLLFAILMAYYLKNYKKEKHETSNNSQ